MIAFAEIRTYSMEQFTFCKMIRKISWAISLMIRLNFDLLDFCNPNVTKCFGCQGHFRQNNQLPECPRNLIIVSKTRRPYRGKERNMKGDIIKCIFSSIRKMREEAGSLSYHIVSLLPFWSKMTFPEHRECLSAASIKFKLTFCVVMFLKKKQPCVSMLLNRDL